MNFLMDQKIFFELRPFFGVFYVVERAIFVPNDTAGIDAFIIVVAGDVVFIQIELIAKPRNEFDKRFVGFVCEFTRGIRMATFNRDGGIVGVGTDRPRDLVKRHTLNDGTVHVNDKMGADAVFVFKIFPVLKRGGSGIGNVMNDDIFYT